jgi:site-specific DNA-methyltransferase (adenine-specific)
MTVPYYEDDLVTLYHGDCLEITEWLAADVLVTDPPYGRQWRQGTIGEHAKNEISSVGISGDGNTEARDRALALWGDGPAVVFGDLMLAPPARTKLTGVYYKSDTTAGFRGAIGGVRRDAEAVYLIGSWPSGLGGRSSVFRSEQMITGASGLVARHGGHPHTKPADVMGELIALSASGIVADPFAGSGSTLVAARNLGRRAIGVEIEERYCELIVKRLAQQAFDFEAISPISEAS